MLTGELDDLTIAVSGLFVQTARLVHHTQAIIAVMDFWIAFQEVACGGFCLIELTLVYEVHDGVGVAGQFILVIMMTTAKIASLMTVVVLSCFGRSGGGRRCQSGAVGELIFSQATALVLLPAAARTQPGQILYAEVPVAASG